MGDTGCCTHGPGYATPLDAYNSEDREKIVYTTAVYTGTGVNKPDFLATIDVDPESKTYSQIIHQLSVPNLGDELHHSGWNTCSSCYGDSKQERKYLILPGLLSGRIYVVDVGTDARAPALHKAIEPSELASKADGAAFPHTVHCLASGDLLVSAMGDVDGDPRGAGFVLINPDFSVKGRWERPGPGPFAPSKPGAAILNGNGHADGAGAGAAGPARAEFGYDFWYQPRHNALVSSSWGAPRVFSKGFNPADVAAGHYGRHLGGNKEGGKAGPFWSTRKQSSWELFANIHLAQSHGTYSNQMGTSLHTPYRLAACEEPSCEHPFLPPPHLFFLLPSPSLPLPPLAVGTVLQGGPQMVQLSLDGKRLYVTNSLFSPWDSQFYPGLVAKGSQLFLVDVDTDKGGLSLNPDFLVDFGALPDGPALAHETRYPGGDCTSDIWL
eukprot:jgi/Mesen1/5069/ME000252S04188